MLKITCPHLNLPYLIEVAGGLWESLQVDPLPFSFRLDSVGFLRALACLLHHPSRQPRM